jgi:cob(I)alamin adenosyltransferase
VDSQCEKARIAGTTWRGDRDRLALVPRLTKIYTRTGDDGSTSLTDGSRVSKSALRIAAYGTVDELNSVIGLALAEGCGVEITPILGRVQNELFHLGADLSLPKRASQRRAGPVVEEQHVTALEEDIDRLAHDLPPLENFILPGGSRGAAVLHVARTVCRRAERHTVGLAAEESVSEWVVRYLNRLSDFLFTAARFENYRRGVPDILWDSRA